MEKKIYIIISILFVISICITGSYLIYNKVNDNKMISMVNSYYNEDYRETSVNNKYLGILKIDKINLEQGFYNIGYKNNNINKNVALLEKTSDNSIIVLAAHSGNSKVSYFKNLNRLEKGDSILLNYQNNEYKYKVIEKYHSLKNGKIVFNKQKEKMIVLTTCLNNKEQLIVVGILTK